VKESTETFTVVLSSPTAGEPISIATGTGTVTIIDNDGAMLAAATATAGAVVEPLTAEALAPVVAQAEALWRAVLPNADFSNYSISIADLPGSQLGWTDGQTTTIDATAAGLGWLRMDLLTVVLHELGRALGFTTDDSARFPAMTATLAPGERLTLGHGAVNLVQAPQRVISPIATPWISAPSKHTVVTSRLPGRLQAHTRRRNR